MRRLALLGFLVLAVLGGDLPNAHSHDADIPGLYNEECPLARLAVPTWSVPALTPTALPHTDAISHLVSPTAFAGPARAVCSVCSPRAPPATS
jgi:hypothetical protein